MGRAHCRVGIGLVASCLLLAAAPPASNAGAAPPPFVGLSLTAALQALQDRGLPVFFSSGVVRESMRVEVEPEAGTLRQQLDDLLAPHGLMAREAVPGRLVVVLAPVDRRVAPLQFAEEIVVVPDPRVAPSREPVGLSWLGRDELASIPRLGDDPLRAFGVVAGTSMREASSRLQVRGGRDDEVLILLDGLELLAPYHLQDFDSALSIVTPTALERAELISSGYPAEYGDRMGGVLDLTTAAPESARRLAFGLGTLDAEVAGSGVLAGGRGAWFGSARGGTYRLPLELHGREADPRFADLIGRVDSSLRPGHSLRLNTLLAEDQFGNAEGGEDYDSRWTNRYVWLTHAAVARSTFLVETIASAGEIERVRSGSVEEGRDVFAVTDRRTLGNAGVKQTWSQEATDRFVFKAGFELRQLGSTVRYANERSLQGPLAAVRSRPAVGATAFRGRFEFDQRAAFLSGKLRPGEALTVELGVRADRDSLTQEALVSPRFNLAWSPTARRVVRLAWGRFYQSQRPNELQVEDDETEPQPAERSEHRVLDFEQRFASGALLRLEAFERRMARTRPRFENLFDPIAVFPELEEDRVLLDSAGALARGIEAAVHGPNRGRVGWWLSYTRATVSERIGGRDVPRAIDQPHAVRAGLSYRTRHGVDFHAIWQGHTGWPTTRVSGRVVTAADGSIRIEPVLGPPNGERLPDYHRLDLRVSRSWDLSRGRLSLQVDVQNLYNRDNARGRSDFEFLPGDGGAAAVRSDTVSWGGILPSLRLRWEL